MARLYIKPSLQPGLRFYYKHDRLVTQSLEISNRIAFLSGYLPVLRLAQALDLYALRHTETYGLVRSELWIHQMPFRHLHRRYDLAIWLTYLALLVQQRILTVFTSLDSRVKPSL